MSMLPGRRCAIYLRVSTAEQTYENQRPDCEAAAESRGLTVVEVYEDKMSGRNPKRPEWQRMLRDARRRQFDYVLVWALDRFGRDMRAIHEAVYQLSDCGVRLVSCREPWLEEAGPATPLILSVLSWVAEQESVRKSKRVKAGMARAAREGKRFGPLRRALSTAAEIDEARALLEAGQTQAQVAERYGVSARLLRMRLREAEERVHLEAV